MNDMSGAPPLRGEWLRPDSGGELVIANARIVTGEECFVGSVRIADGMIADIDRGVTAIRSALNFNGDYLLPGLIDVHTDHLERQVMPRAGMFWNSMNAAMMHDIILCAAGVTTVFDSLIVGAVGNADRRMLLPLMIDGLREGHENRLLRVDHLLHLRCDARESGLIDLFSPHLGNPRLRFVTVMDDSATRDADRFRRLERRKGVSDEVIDEEIAAAPSRPDDAQRNRRRLVEICREHGLPLASHDDTKREHIEESVSLGLTISEFPITYEAARAARDAGMTIIVGAPNIVAGRSHIGNVSVRDLATEGLIDIVCSDYIPASLLHALWSLTKEPVGLSLVQAAAMGSRAPAKLFGLEDRGEIAVGKRADLLRINEHRGTPIVRAVWVGGTAVL